MKYVFLETGHGRLKWREKDDIDALTRYVNDKLGDLCKFVKKVTKTKDGYRDKNSIVYLVLANYLLISNLKLI